MAKAEAARRVNTADASPDNADKRKNLQFRAPDRAYAARVAALARAMGITEPVLIKLAVDKYLAEAEKNLDDLRQQIRERWESAAKDELAALDELARLADARSASAADAATGDRVASNFEAPLPPTVATAEGSSSSINPGR